MRSNVWSKAPVRGLMCFFIITGVASSEVCISTDSTQRPASTLLIYCDNGCCGDPGGQYCCTDNLALMVGCTFGAIGCLGVVVFLIYFCVKKNTQERSRVGPLDRGHHRGAGSTLGGPSGPDFKHVLKPPPYTLDPPPAYTENPPHASAPSFYKNDFEYTTATHDT
uniref:Cysteine and tyrosine-rich protein 1-like n=1 Tax=Crassostrea virginica TaxID=6565 RepID=A0A8B8BEA3_CRAVI|nr:cysteine and tyrosine-rich protein 1-like [Crassostrea virginica]